MGFEVINPATGERIAQYDEMTQDEAANIIESAHGAYLHWRDVPPAERAAPFRKAAAILRERTAEYAALITREMGKTIVSAEAEIEKCAYLCEYYADEGPGFLAPREIPTDASRSFISFQPLGVLLAIMPWNFPFWQVFRFAVPALIGGNAGLLKHASNVPGSALAIEQVFRDAGFPENLFRSLLVGGRNMDGVIGHPKIRQVSLTGSTPAGKKVAAKAGSELKKTILELGGSDPYLILEDADLDHAAATCVTSRLICTGQSCIAAKRFIVIESVLDAFTEKFVAGMRAARTGDPMDRATMAGPLARHDLRDELHDQVVRSVEGGAELLLGGEIPEGPGAYYPPTVLGGVREGMATYEEETFGPVASILPVKDEEEAIRVANSTVFGLGGAVFTQDIARGTWIAEHRLEAGCCFVNAFVKSDPRLPFGGVKESGYGRELGVFGLHELVNVKTVYVK